MNPERWSRLKGMLSRVRELPAEDRLAHLAEECGDDPALLAEAEELVRALDEDPLFLEGRSHLPLDGTRDASPSLPKRTDTVARLGRLRSTSGPPDRYRLEEKIGSGGQGAVYEVFDLDLERRLAMKIVLGRDRIGKPSDPAATDPESLNRFFDEAQITGQLDHPGVVPVHELGIDPDGHVFFTMRLVRGKNLHEVIRELHDDSMEGGSTEWTQPRLLAAVLRACEAVAYAHAKRVIHRDIKPSNLMVGKFGEVYVMDWGLARVLGEEDHHDLRLRNAPPATSILRSPRKRSPDTDDLDSPLETMDGRVLGTPSYMPPEQAEGRIDEMGAASDVYSMGAVLYQLLTGQVPYVPPGARVSPRTVLARVLEGAPTPVGQLAPHAPAELVAICEKAMGRTIEARYPDMDALAQDLRAFLENRVVGAYEHGAWAELRKWVRRNRGWAATGAIAGVLLLAALGWALRSERLATEEKERVLRLSDIKLVNDYDLQAASLYPAQPAQIEAMRDWLDATTRLHGRLPLHQEALADLEARIARSGEEPTAEAVRGSSGEGDLAWQRQVLTELVARLTEIGSETGAIADVRGRLAWAEQVDPLTVSGDAAAAAWERARSSIADRGECPLYDGLEIVPQLGILPLDRNPRTGLWEFWVPRTGARPEPNLGWDANVPGRCNRWILTGKTALIMVLIPGGTFRMGAELPDLDLSYEVEASGLRVTAVEPGSPAARSGIAIDDRIIAINGVATGAEIDLSLAWVTLVTGTTAEIQIEREDGKRTLEMEIGAGVGTSNIDPWAEVDEVPVHEVTLRPYFLSKYEMTVGQWSRSHAEDRHPSRIDPGPLTGHGVVTPWDPVEQVSWDTARAILGDLGLRLPTEAQWERAGRGGNGHAYWSGNTALELQGCANVADSAAKKARPDWHCNLELDDGFAVHGPAGSLLPNPYGLHEVHGGVWEMCLDTPESYSTPVREGDGLRGDHPNAESRVIRGGSFLQEASHTRSANRQSVTTHSLNWWLGIRPARDLELR